MKRTLLHLFCLLLIVSTAQAQEDSAVYIPENGRTYTQVFDSLTSGLISARVPYGVLYDRVYLWSAADTWVSGDTTSVARLYQTWFDMEHSRYDTIAPRTYNVMRQTVNNELLEGRLPLLFISYDFAQIDSIAMQDGRLGFMNSILTDNNIGAPPYTTHRINLAGLPVDDVRAGDTLRVEYDQNLFRLSNTNDAIQSISLADATEGWQYTFSPGNMQPVAFAEEGTHTIMVSITLLDNSVLTAIQRISVRPSARTTNGNYCDPVHRIDSSVIPFKGYGEQYATTSKADWHIYYHLDNSGHCEYKLKKPIIILDGYDPRDGNRYNDIYNDYLAYYLNGTKVFLGEQLRDSGYDVIILNFPKLGEHITTDIPVSAVVQQETTAGNLSPTVMLDRDGGTDFIERNAYLLVKLIQQVNDSLTANSSNEKTVVVGPSMGGQISRYALAYMEQQNALNIPKMNHNTRL